MDRTITLILLAALAFVPALLFLLWERAREQHDREPLGTVLGVFVHGGTLGVAMAITLSLLVDGALQGASALVMAIAVAPLVEEATKGLGLGWARNRITEPEDGLVYGMAVGFGFAATETFLYGLLKLGETGVDGAVFVVIARNLSSLLLHASSSALLGYGYARLRVQGASGASLVGFYLVAAGLHATYNTLVLTAGWAGFVLAVVLVLVAIVSLTLLLRRLDRGAPAPL